MMALEIFESTPGAWKWRIRYFGRDVAECCTTHCRKRLAIESARRTINALQRATPTLCVVATPPPAQGQQGQRAPAVASKQRAPAVPSLGAFAAMLPRGALGPGGRS
jgi:hypothetical protein